jgi:hypothetical protein
MADVEVLTLDEGLKQHLTEGLTLHISLSAIPCCKQAIEAVNSGNQDNIIQLPEGWGFHSFDGTIKNATSTHAYNIIHILKLYKFINPLNLKRID